MRVYIESATLIEPHLPLVCVCAAHHTVVLTAHHTVVLTAGEFGTRGRQYVYNIR